MIKRLQYLLRRTTTHPEVVVEEGLGPVWNREYDTFNILNEVGFYLENLPLKFVKLNGIEEK